VALYVRIPSVQAHRLDARARSINRAKQDIVTDLIADCLDQVPAGERSAAAGVTGGGAGAAGISGISGVAGRAGQRGGEEVLTLSELAALLRLDEATVLDRAAHGDLPGRRFGLQWRFSRSAVLAWLDGNDGFRPGPGFNTRH